MPSSVLDIPLLLTGCIFVLKSGKKNATLYSQDTGKVYVLIGWPVCYCLTGIFTTGNSTSYDSPKQKEAPGRPDANVDGEEKSSQL